MTDEEYMNFLYDRAARRDGFDSYADQKGADDARIAERREKEEAARKADMEAWAAACLRNGESCR